MTEREKDLHRLAIEACNAFEYGRCEYGGLGLDDKRPFGNSDVEGDILEMLDKVPLEEDEGWSHEQREYAAGLYQDLRTFFQVKVVRWIRDALGAGAQ
jgi:hypothetical protein